MFLLIWAALSGVGYGIGAFIFDEAQTELRHFVEDGKPIWGKVIAKDPENHATIRYTYVVDGTSYSGQGGSGRGNPRFDDIKVGDNVVVYYDPTDPAKSFMGYPQYKLQASYSVVVFLAIAFPILPMIVILAIFFAIRAARKTEANEN